jgi:hypothetical protein
LLHARHQLAVLGVDPTVDAPVQVARGLHLAARIRQGIGDLAASAAGLHDVDARAGDNWSCDSSTVSGTRGLTASTCGAASRPRDPPGERMPSADVIFA